MKRPRLPVWGLIGLLVASAAWWALRTDAATRPADPDSPAEADAAEPGPRVHRDARALREALVEVTVAMLRDDAPATRAALDRMEAACRPLGEDDRENLGGGMVTLDQAMHRTLAGTRESSGAGNVDATFDEFFWTQRTCRQCHTLARQKGLLPATGPIW